MYNWNGYECKSDAYLTKTKEIVNSSTVRGECMTGT